MMYHISNDVGVDADIKMMSTSMNGQHLKQKSFFITDDSVINSASVDDFECGML